VPLGLVSGYLGGRLDRVLLLMDTIYTLPGLLLSVTLAFVGRGVLNAAIAISISYIPQYYRVVRNHTQSVKLNYLSKPPKSTRLSRPVSQRNSERASVVHPNQIDD